MVVRALFETSHPKQILIIAQPAASVFQIRLLHVNAVAEFFVAGDLVLHPHLDVFALVAGYAFGTELLTKLLGEIDITG